MSLRRKLICVHIAFAAFAVITASATILGVQIRTGSALHDFERLVDQYNLVEHLRVAAREQVVKLHEIVEERHAVNASFLARREAFFTRLEEVSRFAPQSQQDDRWKAVRQSTRALKEETDRCLDRVQASRLAEARMILTDRVEGDLLDALETQLDSLRNSLDEARQESVNRVLATNTKLLGLAVLIAVSCTLLVVLGAMLVRRWLLAPIADLQVATREFAQGNLSYRVTPHFSDELGLLGTSLNEMASSLATSEAKYRSLFENLRDAVIICDIRGVIVECHNSDTFILGVESSETIGRNVAKVWPDWELATWNWKRIGKRAAAPQPPRRAVDMELRRKGGDPVLADIVTYPVEFGNRQYIAVVLRDVTERHRLQRLVRRTETMEAAVTFARGIAHDFKNLLHSAVTTLSLMEKDSERDRHRERVQTALRACRQATRLSKRLTEFASSDEGHPERLNVSEIVALIVSSLDEPFLAPLRLRTQCDQPVWGRMDRDHLTQVILNLIRNAREAMPDGGVLEIKTESTITANPVEHEVPSPHAVLTVRDSGCGMDAQVQERLFEPLFTTKAHGPDGVRGMGLAVVYAAVTSAGGFVQVESGVGAGSTFRVYLPGGGGMLTPLPTQSAMPDHHNTEIS